MPHASKTVLRTRALIKKENTILLARLGAIYFLPGGRLEQGESITEGIHRELREEAGVSPARCEFVGIHEQRWTEKGEDILEINFMFRAELALEVVSKELQTNDAGVTLHWISESELSKIDLRPRGILEKFRLPATLWGELYQGA